MSYYYPPTYQEGFKSLGFEILEWVTFGTYQGDYAVILKEDDTLGFVVIGYGSCSGCDALEACNSNKEYRELMHSVIQSIYWGTQEELLSKINDEYDDNNWYRHDDEFSQNKSKLIEVLIKGEQNRKEE